MYTIDEATIDAPPDICFQAAADVEGWPEVLPHYRWVVFQRKDGFGTGLVEMAARRRFGPLSYPVWWVSEMRVDETRPEVTYEHVDGITSGMQVIWSFTGLDEGKTRVRIVHSWEAGPSWPLPALPRKWIAGAIIGPLFIHHVATRTLRGIGVKAERIYLESGPVRS